MNEVRVEHFYFSSQYGGDNTSFTAVLLIDNIRCEIEGFGAASDRGTQVKVNNKVQWWCGPDQNSESPELEVAIEELFQRAHKQVIIAGLDPDRPWEATLEKDRMIVRQLDDE